MNVCFSSFSHPLQDIFSRSSIAGEITRADRYGLMNLLMDDRLSEDDLTLLDRLLQGVRRGRIKLVDDIA